MRQSSRGINQDRWVFFHLNFQVFGVACGSRFPFLDLQVIIACYLVHVL